jgi:hypothetical protein
MIVVVSCFLSPLQCEYTGSLSRRRTFVRFQKMLSNNFWFGFLSGAALIFGIFFVGHLFNRARAKKVNNLSSE